MSGRCRLCGSRDGWHRWSCTNLPPCGNPRPDPCENCTCTTRHYTDPKDKP